MSHKKYCDKTSFLGKIYKLRFAFDLKGQLTNNIDYYNIIFNKFKCS